MNTNIQDIKNADQINIYEIFSMLFNKKITLSILFLFLFSSLNIFVYFIDDTYNSEATLMLRSEKSDLASSLSNQFGGVASLAGISVPDSVDNKGALAEKIIDSREFTKILMNKYDILVPIFASKKYDKKSKSLIINPMIYDGEKWLGIYDNSQPSIEDVNEFIRKSVIFRKDKEPGFYYISFDHISPEFSHYFIKAIIKEINLFIQKDELNESERALEYLNKQILQTNYSEITAALNNLAEIQLKKKMFAEIYDDFVFKIIDGPTLADKKSKPNRLLLSIISAIISLIFSSTYVLFHHYIKQYNNLMQ